MVWSTVSAFVWALLQVTWTSYFAFYCQLADPQTFRSSFDQRRTRPATATHPIEVHTQDACLVTYYLELESFYLGELPGKGRW